MKSLATEDFRVENRISDPLRQIFMATSLVRIPSEYQKYVVFNAEHISMMYFIVSQPTPNVIVKNGRVLKEILIPQRQHALQ